MKVLKRVAIAVAAVALLGVMGCQPPLSRGEGDYSGPGLSARDRAAEQRKRDREEASVGLTDGMIRASQALALAQNGLQLKLLGNATLDGSAAPIEAAAPAATEGEAVVGMPGMPSETSGAPEAGSPGPVPLEPEPAPAEATTADAAAPAEPTEGAEPTAAEEGLAAEPAAPQPPEAMAQGALAIQLVDQAYANLMLVREDMAALLSGSFAEEARVKALAELLDVSEDVIMLAARIDPVNTDLLAALEAAEAAEEAAEAAAAAAAEPVADDAAEPAAAGEPVADAVEEAAPAADAAIEPAPADAEGASAPAEGAPAEPAPADADLADAPAEPPAPAPEAASH